LKLFQLAEIPIRDAYLLNFSSKTKKPEKGMIISDGMGIKADSKAIKKKIPPYPSVEMMLMTKELIKASKS